MDGTMDIAAPDVVRTAFAALGASAPVPDLAERRARLAALRAGVLARAEDIARAVDADFGGRPGSRR
jgi:coniferyl-aldehyde dehydrogenase